jgi:predicted Zn-dependent peptidase
MKFKKTTLPNGLRIITIPTTNSPTVTVMALVETGSNYESKSQNGLSHFLEHMCFKGTANRPSALDIARELDGIGAANNAYTSSEVTVYWAKGNKKHLGKIVDVISDLYLNPLLPVPELEKERGVILQEISMYEDLPQAKVWEVLGSLMYGDTPAGRPIIGPAENIKRFKRADFVNYRDKHYVAEKTIVVVSGDIEERDVIKDIKKQFKNIPSGKDATKPTLKERQSSPGIRVHKKKTDQTHMVVSFRSYPAGDKRVPALDMLTNILGQGMSSRLYQKMREEMGACYYVKAVSEELSDHGVFAIATGIEARRSEEVLEAILSECRKFRDELVTSEELSKAKEHYLGHMYMRLENTDNLAQFYGEQEVVSKKLRTPAEIEKEIRKVTAEDVMQVAQDIFQSSKLNLAIVGDIKNESKLTKILKI